jgi:hypothetical protein
MAPNGTTGKFSCFGGSVSASVPSVCSTLERSYWCNPTTAPCYSCWTNILKPISFSQICLLNVNSLSSSVRFSGNIHMPGYFVSTAVDPNPQVQSCSFYQTLPTIQPTALPSTSPPSLLPSTKPSTTKPSLLPTIAPSESPSDTPSLGPSVTPTIVPSYAPSHLPTIGPSWFPSASPTAPTASPTVTPSEAPTKTPSYIPTKTPSYSPTEQPSKIPTIAPTNKPTLTPSSPPTQQPSFIPSETPTTQPFYSPTCLPTILPSWLPTIAPTAPTVTPSFIPSAVPTEKPSFTPSTTTPSIVPSYVPTREPSFSIAPTAPTIRPSFKPTLSPSRFISVCEMKFSYMFDIARVSSSKFVDIQLRVNFSATSCVAGTVFCGAFEGTNRTSTVSQSQIIASNTFSSYAAGSKSTSVLIAGLTPVSQYQIFCMIEDVTKWQSTEAEIKRTALVFKAPCCKQVEIIQNTGFLFEFIQFC